MKNRRYNWEVGEFFVVTECLGTQIYYVSEVNGRSVKGEYIEKGKVCNGGWIDMCYIKDPSKKQMDYLRDLATGRVK